MHSRNDPCFCKSGKRYKHCCGDLSIAVSTRPDITDAQLLAALKRADDRHLAEGLEPGARSMMNVGSALQDFGVTSFLMGNDAPPIVERARRLDDRLFVPRELQVGGTHLGAYLFRDMFCRLYAPIPLGNAVIDPWALVDLTDEQKQWLRETPEHGRFLDQVADVLDFGLGWMEFGRGRAVPDYARDLIWRAHAQLEAAAATATSAYDFRGTVQAALLGAELALKAGLVVHGVPEKELQPPTIGHDLGVAARRLASFEPDFDIARVLRVITTFPKLIANRYTDTPPGRAETGHILMGAQYIASEVTRRFTHRDCRKSNPSASPRVYPA